MTIHEYGKVGISPNSRILVWIGVFSIICSDIFFLISLYFYLNTLTYTNVRKNIILTSGTGLIILISAYLMLKIIAFLNYTGEELVM